MKKILLLITILVIIAGGIFWYSRTEKVVNEPAPNTLQEEIISSPELSKEISTKVDELVKKAQDPSMTADDLKTIEKEVVEIMNPDQVEAPLDDNNPAVIAKKAHDMILKGVSITPEGGDVEEVKQLLYDGSKMLQEAMNTMRTNGTFLSLEELNQKEGSKQGVFVGEDSFHQGAGHAYVIPSAKTIRLENFSVTRGPDLRVTLLMSTGDRVDLGALKGNAGNQNYVYPDSVDSRLIASVQIWCRAFNITFATAVFN